MVCCMMMGRTFPSILIVELSVVSIYVWNIVGVLVLFQNDLSCRRIRWHFTLKSYGIFQMEMEIDKSVVNEIAKAFGAKINRYCSIIISLM